MTKTLVIGGGITGLAASLFLKLRNVKSEVILLESSDRLGGWIRSKRFTDGSIHELGPRTIRMESPTINKMLKVIDNVNINERIIPILKKDKTFQKRFIFAHDKLHLLDFSLLKPAQKPFTESFLKKIVKASLKRHQHEGNFQDFPVDYFVRTRFGDEIADYIVNPVVRGIYACDSRDLSMQSTFGQLLKLESSGSNVIIGAMRNYLQGIFKSNEVSGYSESQELKKYIEGTTVISFKGGMETLIDGLVNRVSDLDVEIRTGSPVFKIKAGKNNQLNVQLSDGIISCDRIISAAPSFVSSVILNGVLPYSDILNNIKWNSVAVVVLEYKGRLITNTGFGHLIPSFVIPEVLGVIYDSCILPENDSQEGATTRYTVMMGGSWFSPVISGMYSDSLITKAAEVLRSQLGVVGSLVRSTVAVNHNCIPVYGLKHRDLVNTVRKSIADQKLPIRLCGNSYDGVSLSDCVQSAHNAVESFYE